MNMDSIVTKGCLPWEPNPAAADLKILWMYQTPLVGIFKHGHDDVLFTATGDSTMRISTWGYVKLEPAEAESIGSSEFDDVDELDDRVSALFEGRRAVFALARDLRIQRYGPLEVQEGEFLLAAVNRFLDEVLEAMKDEGEGKRGTTERVQRAQVDAATHELALAL